MTFLGCMYFVCVCVCVCSVNRPIYMLHRLMYIDMCLCIGLLTMHLKKIVILLS